MAELRWSSYRVSFSCATLCPKNSSISATKYRLTEMGVSRHHLLLPKPATAKSIYRVSNTGRATDTISSFFKLRDSTRFEF